MPGRRLRRAGPTACAYAGTRPATLPLTIARSASSAWPSPTRRRASRRSPTSQWRWERRFRRSASRLGCGERAGRPERERQLVEPDPAARRGDRLRRQRGEPHGGAHPGGWPDRLRHRHDHRLRREHERQHQLRAHGERAAGSRRRSAVSPAGDPLTKRNSSGSERNQRADTGNSGPCPPSFVSSVPRKTTPCGYGTLRAAPASLYGSLIQGSGAVPSSEPRVMAGDEGGTSAGCASSCKSDVEEAPHGGDCPQDRMTERALLNAHAILVTTRHPLRASCQQTFAGAAMTCGVLTHARTAWPRLSV